MLINTLYAINFAGQQDRIRKPGQQVKQKRDTMLTTSTPPPPKTPKDMFTKSSTAPTTRTKSKKPAKPQQKSNPDAPKRKPSQTSLWNKIAAMKKSLKEVEADIGILNTRLHAANQLKKEAQKSLEQYSKSNLLKRQLKMAEKEISQLNGKLERKKAVKSSIEAKIAIAINQLTESLKKEETSLLKVKPAIQQRVLEALPEGIYSVEMTKIHQKLFSRGTYQDIVSSIKNIELNFRSEKEGTTMLMDAVFWMRHNPNLQPPRRLELIQSIFKNPLINPNIKDFHGNTALHLATADLNTSLDIIERHKGKAFADEELEILKLLIEKIEDVPNKKGKKASDFATNPKLDGIFPKKIIAPKTTATEVRSSKPVAKHLNVSIPGISPTYNDGKLARVNIVNIPDEFVKALPNGLIEKMGKAAAEYSESVFFDIRSIQNKIRIALVTEAGEVRIQRVQNMDTKTFVKHVIQFAKYVYTKV